MGGHSRRGTGGTRGKGHVRDSSWSVDIHTGVFAAMMVLFTACIVCAVLSDGRDSLLFSSESTHATKRLSGAEHVDDDDVEGPVPSYGQDPAVTGSKMPDDSGDLVRIDACANACAEETASEDSQWLLEAQQSGDHDTDEIEVCIARCRLNMKESYEPGYVEEVTALSSDPSPTMHRYLQCTSLCMPAVPVDILTEPDAALRTLSRCGVVHLHNAISHQLIATVVNAVQKLRAGGYAGFVLPDFLSQGNLRAGRYKHLSITHLRLD